MRQQRKPSASRVRAITHSADATLREVAALDLGPEMNAKTASAIEALDALLAALDDAEATGEAAP